MTEADELFFRQAAQIVWKGAVVSMAGPLGERRARRPNQAGWKRMLTRDEIVAIHESSHAAAAVAVGKLALQLSIVPNPECRTTDGKYIVGGFCWHGMSEEAEPPEPSNTFKTDRQNIAAAVRSLAFYAPNRRTSALQIFRQIRETAEQIIAENWVLIQALACELGRRKEMSRSEIGRYVAKVRVCSPLVDISIKGKGI